MACGLRAPALGPGGFLLSLLRFSAGFGRRQNCTAPGEMLNMEGSNFWPRKGEPSVSQPFFSISCTFCKEATGSRQAPQLRPSPSPPPQPSVRAHPAGLRATWPPDAPKGGFGAQQQHPFPRARNQLPASSPHPPTQEGAAGGTRGRQGATGSEGVSLVGLNPDPPGCTPAQRQRGGGGAGSGGRRADAGPIAGAGGPGSEAFATVPGRGRRRRAGKRQGLAEPHVPKTLREEL